MWVSPALKLYLLVEKPHAKQRHLGRHSQAAQTYPLPREPAVELLNSGAPVAALAGPHQMTLQALQGRVRELAKQTSCRQATAQEGCQGEVILGELQVSGSATS